MDHLFSLRFAMGSHGEGLCPQNHSLVFYRKTVCTSSYNCHQAVRPRKISWDQQELPSTPKTLCPRLDAAWRPHILFSVLLWLLVKPDCPRAENPMAQPHCRPADPQPAKDFPQLRLCLPIPGAVFWCFPAPTQVLAWDKHSQLSPISTSPNCLSQW